MIDQPPSQPSSQPPLEQEAGTPTHPSRLKVLVAEDEATMARALEIKLKKNGIDVVVAQDGLQAMSELEKGGYALVLLDIMMPQMDGWSVLGAIRDKKIAVKVIIASNLSQEEDRKKAMSMGAVDYIVKSEMSLADIIEKVKGLLV